MREGRVFVRTIAGLKRCDVLWRHVDAEWCDPLELNAASRIGVPGLVDAIRAGGVAVENMPGAGLVESRALLAFLPALARRLIGEDLAMPNIATWWCGQPSERARVLASLEFLFDRRRLSRFRARPRAGGAASWPPNFAAASAPRCAPRSRRAASITSARTSCGFRRRRAGRTARLVPRPFVLRVYAAATPNGWRVMPGGFCRISDKPDARAVSMGEGVESADVWVLAERPVEATSLLPPPEKVRIVRMLGNLPSRAADNLFWFGRYLEREEATLRLVRCLCARAVDPDAPMNGSRQSIERLKSLLVAWGAIDAETARRKLRRGGRSGAARQRELRLGAVDRPRGALRRLGDPRAPDAADLATDRPARNAHPRSAAASARPKPEILDCIDEALTTIAALAGLFDENFNRGAGWIFYELGRRIERGINTCRLARQFAEPGRHRIQSRRAARSHQFADHLSLAHPDRRRAGAGARHGAARSVQSALGRVSGQCRRRAYRRAARAAAGRRARGAAPARDAAARGARRPNTPNGSRIRAFWRSSSG